MSELCGVGVGQLTGCSASVQWARGHVQDADTSSSMWDGHGDVSQNWEGLLLCPDNGCAALGAAVL